MTLGTLQTECTVSGVLSFVLRLSQVFGVAPLLFEDIRDGFRIRASKVVSCYGRFLALPFFVLSIIGLVIRVTVDNESKSNSTIANRFVWIVETVIVGLVALNGSHTAANRMKHMIDCIAELKQINKELKVFDQPMSRNETRVWLLVTFLLTSGLFNICMQYGVLITSLMNSKSDVYSTLIIAFYVCFSISSFVLELLVLQFALIVMSVLEAMELLNTCLKSALQRVYNNASPTQLTSQSITKNPIITKKNLQNNVFNRFNYKTLSDVINSIEVNVVGGGTYSISKTIHRCAYLYGSLCDMIRQLNSTNGSTLVLIFLSFLLHLIITPYYFVTGILDEKNRDIPSVLLQVSWAVYHVSNLLLVVEPCQRTHEQMDLTRNMVNQMKRYSGPDDYTIVSELKLFERHLLLNQVTYCPMQLFNLDRSLLVAIMGSVTTYLVIVIQL